MGVLYAALIMMIAASLLSVYAKVMLIGKKPSVLTGHVAAPFVVFEALVVLMLAFSTGYLGAPLVPTLALCLCLGTEMALTISRVGKEPVVKTPRAALYGTTAELVMSGLALTILLEV
jgi:hypothetical protein